MAPSNIFHFVQLMHCFFVRFSYLRWLPCLITMTKSPATKWIWLNPSTWPCQLMSPDTSLLTAIFYGLLSSRAGIFMPYHMFSALNNCIFWKIITKIKNYLEGWNYQPFQAELNYLKWISFLNYCISSISLGQLFGNCNNPSWSKISSSRWKLHCLKMLKFLF